MKREIVQEARAFLIAVQFLTRVPIPHWIEYSPAWFERSMKWFPLTGALVGAASAGCLWLGSHLWTMPLAAFISVAVGAFLTGAFHEDGFADFFDALGGATREARLVIMRDSRVGTYGALALGFTVLARAGALASLPLTIGVPSLIAAHAGGRLATLGVVWLVAWGGGLGPAKTGPAPNQASLPAVLLAGVCGLLPAFALGFGMALAAVLAGALAATAVGAAAVRLIGGYTGDVLGAAEQSYEIAFLLAVAACV